MRSCARIVVAAFVLIAAVQPVMGQQAAGNIRFRFAFGALTGTGTNRTLVRITEDTKLKTGDQIKLLAQLEQPGFLYVIHRGPDNEITLLAPADLKQGLPVGIPYFMPKGASWFELDKNPGDETVYVLASTQRLESLESLLQRYSSAPAAGKASAATDIVSEIRKLRTQNRDATTQAERPVMIGGNVRSLNTAGAPDISTIAVEITAKDFFARTFTIDHR
jgi:Domain of unknown function (DUF4384)